MFKTKSGATGFKVMSHDDVLAHAKRFSKSYNREKNIFSGPWQTDFDAMGKVVVLKAALKYAPLKSDFITAVANDTAVRSELSSDMLSTPREDDVIDADYIEETPPPEEE